MNFIFSTSFKIPFLNKIGAIIVRLLVRSPGKFSFVIWNLDTVRSDNSAGDGGMGGGVYFPGKWVPLPYAHSRRQSSRRALAIVPPGNL